MVHIMPILTWVVELDCSASGQKTDLHLGWKGKIWKDESKSSLVAIFTDHKSQTVNISDESLPALNKTVRLA